MDSSQSRHAFPGYSNAFAAKKKFFSNCEVADVPGSSANRCVAIAESPCFRMHGRQKTNTDLAQWMDWLRNKPHICGVGASVSSQTSPVLRSTALVYKKRAAHPDSPPSHTLFFYTLTLVPHTLVTKALSLSQTIKAQ